MNIKQNIFSAVLVLLLIGPMTNMASKNAYAKSIEIEDAMLLKPEFGHETIDAEIGHMKTLSSIEPPMVIWDNTEYNMVVRYDWRVGRGGNDLAMSRNRQYFDLVGDMFYRTYEFPEHDETDHCDPSFYQGKSYDSSTDTYSSSTTTLEHSVKVGENSLARYGYECKYVQVGSFGYALFSSGDTIPTSFDKEHYIWNHNAGNGDIIKGTIQYKNQLADIEVEIPWIGYNNSSVYVGNDIFYIRTGPNKCSIRVDSPTLSAIDLKFSFGVKAK